MDRGCHDVTGARSQSATAALGAGLGSHGADVRDFAKSTRFRPPLHGSSPLLDRDRTQRNREAIAILCSWRDSTGTNKSRLYTSRPTPHAHLAVEYCAASSGFTGFRVGSFTESSRAQPENAQTSEDALHGRCNTHDDDPICSDGQQRHDVSRACGFRS